MGTVDHSILYGGHSLRSKVEAYTADTPVDFFTFYRDPEQRLLSNLRFHFKFEELFGRKSHFLPGRFDRIHEQEGINKVLEIIQEDDPELHFALRNIQAYFTRRCPSGDKPEAAAADVHSLAAVGLTENYPMSLLLLACKLGFLPPRSETRANETGPGRPIVLNDRNREFYLASDEAYYAVAREKHASDLEAMFSDFGTRDPLLLRQKIIERTLKSRQATDVLAGSTDGEWRKCRNGFALADDEEDFDAESLWAISGVSCEVWIRFPSGGRVNLGFSTPYADEGDDSDIVIEVDGERRILKTSSTSIEIGKPELSGRVARITILSDVAGRSDYLEKRNQRVTQDFPNVALRLSFSGDADAV